jgi:hypothetical protein
MANATVYLSICLSSSVLNVQASAASNYSQRSKHHATVISKFGVPTTVNCSLNLQSSHQGLHGGVSRRRWHRASIGHAKLQEALAVQEVLSLDKLHGQQVEQDYDAKDLSMKSLALIM